MRECAFEAIEGGGGVSVASYFGWSLPKFLPSRSIRKLRTRMYVHRRYVRLLGLPLPITHQVFGDPSQDRGEEGGGGEADDGVARGEQGDLPRSYKCQKQE